MKYLSRIVLLLLVIFAVAGCTAGSTGQTKTEVADTKAVQKVEPNEGNTMTLLIDGKEYPVKLDKNATAQAVAARLPLKLAVEQLGGHEYYARLNFKPPVNTPLTSQVKAGHLYYWEPWASFVINYIEMDISPYQILHIGEVEDKTISNVLKNSPRKMEIEVK